MKIQDASRMKFIPSYAFDEIKKKVVELKRKGRDVIDLTVGDPVKPPPERVLNKCCEAVRKYSTYGYPPYKGLDVLMVEASSWMRRSIGVSINREEQILVTLGSKEAIFHFAFGIINEGEYALVPSPGYPPYVAGTVFAGGSPVFYPLEEKNNFLPDLNYIEDVLKKGKVKVMWICYPNAPTGKVAGRRFYQELVDLLEKFNVILCSDEAYIDFIYDGQKCSPLQIKQDGIVSFYSLSKRSNMTGYRVGWVAGDERLVTVLHRIKMHLDSGTPCFVQEAAAEALRSEVEVVAMRDEYRGYRDSLCSALSQCGLESCVPEGGLYIWQKVPDGLSSHQFSSILLEPEISVATIPGSLIANDTDGGKNPGEGYVRFSLTGSADKIEEACRRIKDNLVGYIESWQRKRDECC